jgi:hypothetical protein
MRLNEIKEKHVDSRGNEVVVGDMLRSIPGTPRGNVSGKVLDFTTYNGTTKAVIWTKDWHSDGSWDTLHLPLSVSIKG